MPPGLSSQMTIKRIHREIADLRKEDLGPITLEPSESNIHVWKGSIPGPQGSLYEGGVYNVEITLPPDYPFSAPKVIFKTRIYHMNISEQGNICIDILKQNWSPALSLFKVMLSLSSLLTDPNPKDPLVPSIATQFMQHRKQHDATARLWTEQYARPKPPPPPAVAPIPAPASAPKSAKGKGKKRAEAAPPVAAGASSSNSRSTRSSVPSAPNTSTAFIILDSDDEGDRDERSTAASNTKGKKRKRPDAASVDPDGVVDLINAEDEEAVIKRSRTRKAQSRAERASGAAESSRRSSRQLGDVIVIDDD
ncbi:ubiquitin-conjugating enzyme/RWD-like protein [Crassisporium funariophilum]|nr:ubiquitin-conjugating enzyme/RWD-like protein [Crassisporium funariophilum]